MNAVRVAAPECEAAAPDRLVSERVEDALKSSGYSDLRRSWCEYDRGIVTIKGQVGSYFLKQMAQVLAARVEGVTGINNQLRVAPSNYSSGKYSPMAITQGVRHGSH